MEPQTALYNFSPIYSHIYSSTTQTCKHENWENSSCWRRWCDINNSSKTAINMLWWDRLVNYSFQGQERTLKTQLFIDGLVFWIALDYTVFLSFSAASKANNVYETELHNKFWGWQRENPTTLNWCNCLGSTDLFFEIKWVFLLNPPQIFVFHSSKFGNHERFR